MPKQTLREVLREFGVAPVADSRRPPRTGAKPRPVQDGLQALRQKRAEIQALRERRLQIKDGPSAYPDIASMRKARLNLYRGPK